MTQLISFNQHLKILLFTIFIFQISLFNAQLTLQKGTEFKKDKKSSFLGFLSLDSNNIYALERNDYFLKNNEFIIQTYNKKSLLPIHQFSLTPDDKNDFNLYYKEIFSLKNKIFLITELQDKKNGNTFLTANIYDFEGNKLSTEILDTFPKNFTEDENYHFITAKDENSFVYIHSESSLSGFNQDLEVQKFDALGNMIKKSTINLQSTGKQYSFADFEYDGKNQIYFTAELSSMEKHAAGRFRSSQSFSFWSYDLEKDVSKETEIIIKEKYIQCLKVKPLSNSWLVAGYYSDVFLSHIKGAFTLLIDSNLNIVKGNANSFDGSTLENKKDLDLNFQDYRNLKINSIEIFNDSSYALVAEVYFREINVSTDQRNTQSINQQYNFEDVIITFFNKEGKFIENTNIPKVQSSLNDEGIYSSYALLIEKENKVLNFVFWDNEKNEKINDANRNKLKQTNPILFNSLNVTSVRQELTENSTQYQSERERKYLINKKEKTNFKPSENIATATKIYFFTKTKRKYQIIYLQVAE